MIYKVLINVDSNNLIDTMFFTNKRKAISWAKKQCKDLTYEGSGGEWDYAQIATYEIKILKSPKNKKELISFLNTYGTQQGEY
jgi:hypothetical protein